MHRSESPLPVASGWRPRPLAALQRVAFWLAVVLPVGYVPLLGVGLEGDAGVVLLCLLVVNLGCLVVGHGHAPTR